MADQDTLNLDDGISNGSMLKNKMHSIDDVSAITAKQGPKSNSDIVLAEFFGHEDYSEVDMGQIEEEELPFMIIDKDSGKVYDTRNNKHVERLSNVTASFRQTQTEEVSPGINNSTRSSCWGDWWRMKKKNDQEYLWAAESGELDKLKRYIDKEIMKDMVADINAKGLDQWTALHFAADQGHLEIVLEVIK